MKCISPLLASMLLIVIIVLMTILIMGFSANVATTVTQINSSSRASIGALSVEQNRNILTYNESFAEKYYELDKKTNDTVNFLIYTIAMSILIATIVWSIVKLVRLFKENGRKK